MTEEQRTFAAEQLQRIIANAPSRREVAWREIQSGFDPAYVAMRYGYSLEQMQQAQSAHLQRVEAERAGKGGE